jgi:hypothetical protein
VLLAVQTLRNSILVSSFVGANVLSIGVSQAMLYESYAPNNHRAITSCCIVSACFICSFLCWTNVIRYCAHLGYLIGSMTHEPKKPATNSATTATARTTAAEQIAVELTSTTATSTSEVRGHKEHDHKQSVKKFGFSENPDTERLYATQLARYLLMSFR